MPNADTTTELVAREGCARRGEHPYQVLPALSEADYVALKESIRAHGRVLVGIVTDAMGNVLDGHHRLRAVEELRAEGVEIPDPLVLVYSGTEPEKQALILALNLARRHLSPEQRREVIEHLRQQGWSLRAIATAAGVSKSQVQRDLAAAVPDGTPEPAPVLEEVPDDELPAVVRGRDGKHYPARKPDEAAQGRRGRPDPPTA